MKSFNRSAGNVNDALDKKRPRSVPRTHRQCLKAVGSSQRFSIDCYGNGDESVRQKEMLESHLSFGINRNRFSLDVFELGLVRVVRYQPSDRISSYTLSLAATACLLSNAYGSETDNHQMSIRWKKDRGHISVNSLFPLNCTFFGPLRSHVRITQHNLER